MPPVQQLGLNRLLPLWYFAILLFSAHVLQTSLYLRRRVPYEKSNTF